MKVILREEIPALGKLGDIVEVRKGYARNFLIPKKKALEATERNIKALEMEKSLARLKLERGKAKAQKVAEQLRDMTCIIEQKVGLCRQRARVFMVLAKYMGINHVRIVDNSVHSSGEITRDRLQYEQPAGLSARKSRCRPYTVWKPQHRR